MKHPMKHRPLRLAVAALFAALLTVAAGTRTAAQQAATATADQQAVTATADQQAVTATADQQAADSGATAEASATQAGTPSATLPGPRLPPQFLPFEPNIAESSPDPWPVPPAPTNNTFVISTLGLVLIAVIVTILVVK